MDIAIQPNLVERAVFEAARRDAELRPLYERQFADCHAHRDADARDRAFAELHLRWFDELGLRDAIVARVNEFPNFRAKVDRLRVAQAPGPRAQTAELFGAPGRYTVVVAVAPATLLDPPAFDLWARHEFMHIDDLLEPAFRHADVLRPSGANAAARSLAQDRYTVLWALSVDFRLIRRGLAPAELRARRAAELRRAFGLADESAADRAIDALLAAGLCDAPSHPTLLQWAEHGLPGVDAAPGESAAGPLPGAPCPLCGFRTYDWQTDFIVLAELSDIIAPDFPGWTPHRPICRRCAEVYRSCRGAVPA